MSALRHLLVEGVHLYQPQTVQSGGHEEGIHLIQSNTKLNSYCSMAQGHLGGAQ